MQYSVYAARCGERIAHLENGVRDGLTGMDALAAADRLHAERGSGLERTDVVEPDEGNDAVKLEPRELCRNRESAFRCARCSRD